MIVNHELLNKDPADVEDPVQRALVYAVRYGQIDGEHHKTWVIDQMVRALTNCPIIKKLNPHASTEDGKGFRTIEVKSGDEGPESYEWDCGTCP